MSNYSGSFALWRPNFFRLFAFLRVVFATLSTYLVGYLFTFLGVSMGVLASLVGWKGFLKVGPFWWSNFVFYIVGRKVHIQGEANVEPEKTYLVVANHSSLYDVPALMASIPGVAILGREYLQKIPLFGTFLKAIHFVPIDTKSIRKARHAIDKVAETLTRGTTVAMFPEGTRTPDGKMQALRRGFIHILRQSGCDLLPVTISGTFALKPKGRLTMDPRERIEVLIHPPIANTALVGLSDEEIVQSVRSILDVSK